MLYGEEIGMDDIILVGEFFADCFVKLWSAIGTWGVIGVGIIAPAVLYKVGNLVKKIFQF